MIRVFRTALCCGFIGMASAETITLDRIAALPPAEQEAWKSYLARSQSVAAADEAALKAELAAHQLANAIAAPSGGDFKLPESDDSNWYSSDEAKSLADTIISYQAPSGGWSKHTGYSKGPRDPGMLWSSQYQPGQKPHYLCTFDNRSTTEQITFLANVWLATKRDDCRTAAARGLEYILKAQYPNGGWPQVYPLEGAYHDSITFNDDATAHILETLISVREKSPCYDFLDEKLRAEITSAYQRGIACVLRTQITLGGKKTGWCAQYDALTLTPEGARKMEPATISGLESSNLLAFLMRVPDPDADLVSSIDSGLQWLDQVKITGLSRTKVEGKTAYEPNPASTEVYWARFYSLAESKPIFPGRDGVIYTTFTEMAAKNKLGYDFYTTRPGSVVNSRQKKWRKMLAFLK